MAINITGKFKPQGNFALLDAEDVEMPDGTRLSNYHNLPGKDGKDGTSATHSWNGTVLTITSASGTSSADLKGEPGKDGVDGKNGADGQPGADGKDGKDGQPGKDGYSPVKYVDYWTDEDKNEIVNEVLEQMPESEGGSAEVPTFDLGAMGLPAVTLPIGNSQVGGDTSAIISALDKGSAKFVVPVSISGVNINITLTMQGFTDGTGYQCVSFVVQDIVLMAIVAFASNGVQVMVAPAVTFLGFPAATAADNGKILQVVNGTWTPVAVADSAVKTYVDEYIDSALEGDY